jgi:fido (protein-threonine AMPylation protein)
MKDIEQKVYKACEDANWVKLQEVLSIVKDENQKQQIKKMFSAHMQEITDFILNSNFLKTWKLDENFIKTLHKKLFPPNYKETKKSLSWKDIVYLIPWEYKIFENYPRVSVANTKKEILKWINDYNQNINKVENKFDFIALKVVDFFKIHPFANANGITISIIFDLMLISNGYKNYWLKRKYLIPWFKEEFFKVIEKYILQKDIKSYLTFIKKHY